MEALLNHELDRPGVEVAQDRDVAFPQGGVGRQSLESEGHVGKRDEAVVVGPVACTSSEEVGLNRHCRQVQNLEDNLVWQRVEGCRVGGVGAAPYRGATGASHVACLEPRAKDDVKFDDFSIAEGGDCLLGVILEDGRLVNKDVLLGVVPVDEAVTRFDIEPLDSPPNLVGDDFLWLLVFLVSTGEFESQYRCAIDMIGPSPMSFAACDYMSAVFALLFFRVLFLPTVA